MRLPNYLWIAILLLPGCTNAGYDAVGQTAVDILNAKNPDDAAITAEQILLSHGYTPARRYVLGHSDAKEIRFYSGHGSFATLEQTTPSCFTLVSYVSAGSSELASARRLLLDVRSQADEERAYRIPFAETCGAP